MHVPAVDRARDDAEWRDFVRAQAFGHLVAPGRDRDVPVIVPTQFVLDRDEVLLHVAAANPLVRAIEEHPRAVLSVAGDWAFIPSSWKAIGDESPEAGIPTTYYAAVQIAGAVELVAEPARLAAVLRRQLAVLQPGIDVDDPERGHAARLAAIRGVVLRVEHVAAKFKYGGNVDEAHRRAVIDRLVTRNGPGDAAAAAHARRRLDAPEADSSFRR